MTAPNPAETELLYRKPGTVTAAQTLMWVQFSFLLCCGTGGTFAVLFSAGILREIDFRTDFVEDAENLVAIAAAVVVGVIAVAVLFGVLAAKLGAGRRWAQVLTIVVMLVSFSFGFVGIYTGFQVEDNRGAPIDASDLFWTLMSLAVPAATLICLFTGSANQWLKQGGRDPLRQMRTGYQPYPQQWY